MRERLNELRNNLKGADLMPWNDPHTAAPSLWAWHNAEHYEDQCSAAPLDLSSQNRRGTESFLLYKYRQERRESTLCNFGRFHPRYTKSTNRKKNSRGGKLPEWQNDNLAGLPSIAPLEVAGKPGDSDWMKLDCSQRALSSLLLLKSRRLRPEQVYTCSPMQVRTTSFTSASQQM